jgi:hypothetical protein
MDDKIASNIKTYIAIGYWYSDQEEYFPDPAWFVQENYDEEEKNKVIAYLNNSEAILYSRGISWCRFACKKDVPGSSDLTDGVFIYPSGLIHYVECHNVRLPQAFLDKILKGIQPEGNLLGDAKSTFIRNYHDCYVDFSWWINQKGIDPTQSTKRSGEVKEDSKIYIYRDGTKKIETAEKIEMIFPDGRIEVIMK